MKTLVKSTMTLLFLVAFASIANAGQPAYITNIYTCSKTVDMNGFPQPDEISNIWRANIPDLRFQVVANMVLTEKGRHTIEIDIYDPNGGKLDELNFDPTEATMKNYTYTISGHCGGRYPEGLVLLKIYDKFKGNRVKIMEQGILMKSW